MEAVRHQQLQAASGTGRPHDAAALQVWYAKFSQGIPVPILLSEEIYSKFKQALCCLSGL